MRQISTITSKRQLTIPSSIFRKTGLKKGQKVIISERNGSIKIVPTLVLVNNLAGSVRIPNKYRKLSADEIIEKSKEKYLKNKK